MNIEFAEMLKFNKELYSKTALIKAAYNFTDRAYVHLDADAQNYYVFLSAKEDSALVSEEEFLNEILAQSVRHEVYRQTKNIRELMLARAMASSVILEEEFEDYEDSEKFAEDEILKDWFEE
ncbi:MAG: His-Xaa-Ser system protein HxsD [Lachnospiraceae bacterium]|nr:His-Xaa-Ser system protein HxsD [Lachnospiraceae bacterium]